MKSEKSQNVNKDRNYVRVSSVRIGTLPNEKIRTPILKSRHSEKRKIQLFYRKNTWKNRERKKI